MKDTCQTSWSRGAKCGRLLSAHTLKTEKNKSNIKTGSHTFATMKHHTSLNVLLSRNFEFRDYRVHVSTYNGTENSVSLTMRASNFESDATSSHFAIYETRRKEQEGRSNIIKIMTKSEAAGQVPDQEEQLRTMEKVRVNCEVPFTAMMFWNMTCRLDRARRKLDDQLRDALCRVAISPCSCSSSFFSE